MSSIDQQDKNETETTAAREYHAPVFTHHGSAANIVRNNEGVGSDGGAFDSDTLS